MEDGKLLTSAFIIKHDIFH